MSSRSIQVRVSKKTQKAINVIAARLQEKSMEIVTADTALWSMISRLYPDVAKRLAHIEGDEENGNGDEEPDADPL